MMPMFLEKKIHPGGFAKGQVAQQHYFPSWTHWYATFDSYGLLTRFPNASNLEFKVGEKKTEVQSKALDNEKVFSNGETIAIEDIQTLLTKN